MSDQISFDDFLKVDIRVGTVTDAQPYPEARKPAIDDTLLLFAVAVPVDHLVRKPLAATADCITDSGRADSDTGGFYRAVQHGQAAFETAASVSYRRCECTV